MKVVSAAQIAAIDRRTIDEVGLPGAVLMENAGRAIAREAMQKWPAARAVTLLCGPGNNGGDGFVAARSLLRHGRVPRVLLVGAREHVRGDAALHLRVWESAGGEATEVAEPDRLGDEISGADLLVDALFGTGLARDIEGRTARLVELANASPAPVVAADIPSGICSDTGRILGCAVRADLTVTMGLPKLGLLLQPGADHAGEVRVAEIGFLAADLESQELPGDLLDAPTVAAMLPRRLSTAHKGSCGRALVVAGSADYPGAAALAVEAALRAGAGLVRAALPASIRNLVAGTVREAITVPLERSGRFLVPEDVGAITELAEGVDSLSLGPGIGRNPQTVEAVRRLLQAIDLPMVLDADALRAVAGMGHVPPRAVLTPHPGEMAALLDVSIPEIESDRVGAARRCAERYGAVTILKGAPTIVATPGGRFWINGSGSPVLAQGGTGDVLTGAVGGILAQGASPTDAACCAVFVHGLAGDLCAAAQGPRGVLAGEVARALPEAIGRVLEGTLPRRLGIC